MNKSFKEIVKPGKKNLGTILQIPSEEIAEMLMPFFRDTRL